MKSVEETYRESFFHRRKSLIWRAPILCGIIEQVFPGFKSIIDVGCAIGEFVHEFKNRGYYSKGMEGSSAAEKYLLPGIDVSFWDIRRELPASKICSGKIWNVCMCLEVAEHIEAEYVETFIDNLCFLSNQILISAAPPGQQGHGHFNCQPKEYWEEKFKLRLYHRNIKKEEYFKVLLGPHKRKKGLNGYYNNTMIYEYKWRPVV